MEKFITDERTGLQYELVGDYYLIAGEDEPEGRPIGIWGQRHLRYIRKHKVSLYAELLTTGKLNDYLADLNEQAEASFSRLVKQLSEKENCFCIKVYPLSSWCGRWDLNPYGLPYAPQTYASACSATTAFCMRQAQPPSAFIIIQSTLRFVNRFFWKKRINKTHTKLVVFYFEKG